MAKAKTKEVVEGPISSSVDIADLSFEERQRMFLKGYKNLVDTYKVGVIAALQVVDTKPKEVTNDETEKVAS